MAQKKETENALGRELTRTDEIVPERAAEEARAEIQSAIIVAKRMPRKEEVAYQKLMHACTRTSFAEGAMYAFPRWSSDENKNVTITGPSVNLAREAGRVWGNIRWGLVIIASSKDERTIEGYAYDLETNTRIAQEDSFQLIGFTRKDGWGPLNERGVRELTARRGAFLIRNSILQLIPRDFIDDAMAQVEKTLSADTKQDPDAKKKSIISAFDGIGVPIAELETYLGHGMGSVSPQELTKLRTIYKSIDDGNSTWAEYLKPAEAPTPTDKGKEPAAPRTPKPASSTNEAAAPRRPQQSEKKDNGGPKLSDPKKGIVWQLARKKGWSKGSGDPNDPLHTILRNKYKGIESVADVLESDFSGIVELLTAGPAAAGLKPVS
jgi:hypothetical protein